MSLRAALAGGADHPRADTVTQRLLLESTPYDRFWPLAGLQRLALANREEERVTLADDPFSTH